MYFPSQPNEFCVIFLGAMSSSSSDVVTQFVFSCFRVSVFSYFRVFMFSCFRVFVRPLFFLLVSLKFLLALKSFNGDSRQFKGCLRFNGSFKDVSRALQGCFKEV